MALTKEAVRITRGQELNSIYSQAVNNINQLKDLKARLLNIKGIVQTDTALYTAEDLADVNQVIQDLAGQLSTI